MIIGEPYKLGFIIERITEWEDESYKNGIMFFMINGEIYPKDVRTATFNCELPELLDESSAMRTPVVNRELFQLESKALFGQLTDITYGKNRDALYDMRYLIPFHEITDAGYSIFIISNGKWIKLLAGRWQSDEIVLENEIELPKDEYMKITDKLKKYYETFE